MAIAGSPYFARGTGAENFPDPFIDIATLAMPRSLRNALQWCLVPGTMIELRDCQFKPVESITTADVVLTRGGTLEHVVQTSVREVDEDIVRLEFGGYGCALPLRLTGNHKVWRIRTPNMKPNRVLDKLSFEAAERVSADQVGVGDYFVTPLPRRDWQCPRTHPAGYPAGQARFSGWLTGVYAAEGCGFRDANDRLIGCRFTLGRDDEATGILAKLITRLENETGKVYKAYIPPSRQDTRLVTAHDPELPDWMTEHIPGLAQTKTISPAVLGYDDAFLLGLLGGMIDGDGNISQAHGEFKGSLITSASELLLRGLQRAAYAVGMTPSLVKRTNAAGSYGGVNSLGFTLNFDKVDCSILADYSIKLAAARSKYADFATAKGKTSNVLVRDGYVYHRVKAAVREHYAGPVYNFEVENDHSYIADGVAVSNCEYIAMSHGTYRMATERVLSYFLTDIEFGESEAGDEEKEKWADAMKDPLDVLTSLQNSLRNRLVYGNDFTSVLVPFKRFLCCPKCGSAYPLKTVYNTPQFNFAWDAFHFTATCPHCKTGAGYRGPWRVDDKPDDESRKLKIKKWNVHEIEILHDYYTDETAYLWRIPEDYKAQVRKGNLYHLERVSQPVLEAIRKNQMFRFNPDVIYHMKEPCLAGIRNRGWGIPRILSNFRQIYYVQVLRRYNEAIALDYVIPFRLLTPMPRAGGGGTGTVQQTIDPLMMFNMGDFRSQVSRMLAKRRRDPASWNVLPFPVQYQMLGGDASKLAPVDLINQGTEQLLNDVGTPVELYKGTMQLQSSPVSLRLFEATWHHLVHDANSWLKWLVRQVSQIMSWEVVDAKLKRVTIADDINKQMALLQMYMGQSVSGTTALKSLGIDWKAEQKQTSEEAEFTAKQQAKVQADMDSASFSQQMAQGNILPASGGAPPAGGAPPSVGGAPPAGGGGAQGAPAAMPGPVSSWLASMSPSTPVTPKDLMDASSSIANQLLGLPEGQKDSELHKLKAKNEVLHALVRSKMDATRNTAKQQGGAQMLQSQFGR